MGANLCLLNECVTISLSRSHRLPDELPEMRKEPCASRPPAVEGLGRELAFAAAISLSRMPTPLLRIPFRNRIAEASDSRRKAHHEVASIHSLAAHAWRTHPLLHQFADFFGSSLLPAAAADRHRITTSIVLTSPQSLSGL
jgi:hypothetical protein